VNRHNISDGETFVIDNVSYHDIIKSPRKSSNRGFAIYVTLKLVEYDFALKAYKVEVIGHCGVYDSPNKELLHRGDELWLKANVVNSEYKRWSNNREELWRRAGNAGKPNSPNSRRKARESVSKLWSADLRDTKLATEEG